MRITDHSLSHDSTVSITTESTEAFTALTLNLAGTSLTLFAADKEQLMSLAREINRQVASIPDTGDHYVEGIVR